MSDNRIVCTIQDPAHLPPKSARIVKVGTGTDPNQADQFWTVERVIEELKKPLGHRFHTIGTRSGRRAEIVVAECPIHGWRHEIIKSVGDVVTDNNLDELRECRS